MEEKKGRSILCAAPARVLTVVVTLLCVAVFSGSVGMLMTLSSNGMGMEELWSTGEKSYESTWRCGSDIANYMVYLNEQAEYGTAFTTDGKLDPEKTVDITDEELPVGKQRENTSYTVENLQRLSQYAVEFSDLVYQAENGYYEYWEEESGELTQENSEDSYSSAFRYLYENGRDLEQEALPVSGTALADYARENSDTVSLLDLYKDLSRVLENMNSYLFASEQMNVETNILYCVENTNTGVIYTNVDEWEEGYRDLNKFEEYKEQFFFHGIRTDGNLETAADSISDSFTAEHFDNLPLTGENEEIILMVNTDYPVQDYMATSAAFYERYISWGQVLVIAVIASLALGIISFILLTLQAGRVREDRQLHLKSMDRLPTEVTGAIAGIALFVMTGMGISMSLNGSSLYWESTILMAVMELGAAAVFLWFYTSLVRRFKGKLLWKSSLTRNILVSCRKVYAARMTSGRMITAFILLMLGNMFVLLAFRSFGLLLALIGDGVVLLYLLKEGAGRQVIRDGLARIAGGELDFKIDERELTGDNREMAEAVNHVGDGLQKAVQETVKSERLKADLITNVSHDIKTPLTSIINYVDLLKRENIQDPKIKGYIQVLDSKSQRLKQLTEDLVEASKISSGNVVLDMRPINLGELVWQTNGEFEEKFASRGLEIVSRIPDTPVRILADGRRMWRVVENLYNNVAKYAMPDTRVYVEVKKIGCRVVFQVKNISEHSLNAINADELTERFIRGDVSRSTEGSGLGLSIAKNLVKLQKGTFDIYLDGDLFKVVITFAAAENQESPENNG